MTLHAPQLDLPLGAKAPDDWEAGKGIRLLLDHVISRDADGDPVSRLGDFQWDLTYYHPRRKSSKLIFWYWRSTVRTVLASELNPSRVARIRELQYLMFLRIYLSERMVGVKQLVAMVSLLRNVAAFAEARNITVREVFERAEVLDDFIIQLPLARSYLLIAWISFLRTLDSAEELGFELARPRLWHILFERAKQYRDGQGQHAPLPTAIYLRLIQSLSAELDMLESYMDRIHAAVRGLTIMSREYNARGWKMGASSGPELMVEHGLEGLLSDYECAVGCNGFTSLLTQCQRIAKLQIHVFSGMRSEEAQYLPYHCMEYQNAGHGRKHAWIRGVTTKLAGARNKRTGWVTTDEQGFRAIRIAQRVASMIYEVIGATPSEKDSDKDSFPLFVSAGLLPWKNDLEKCHERFAPSSSLHIAFLPETVRARLFGVTEHHDIEELEAIDPFRDWTAEPEFKVGKRWQLKTHQLRRSLALYSNASGLVKSSSLRRQLQHITNEMAYYYGRGSVYAKNFLKDDPKGFKDHIAVEWQDSDEEAQYLAFTRDVLNSDEPLCGPAGIFYDLQKARGEVMSVQEAKDQLKSGRMAYKAHPLGGCTHVGTCNKQKGLRLTSGICVSEACKNLIGKHSHIIKVIPVQRGMLARLDPESIAYAMEKEELDILETTEQSWRRASEFEKTK